MLLHAAEKAHVLGPLSNTATGSGTVEVLATSSSAAFTNATGGNALRQASADSDFSSRMSAGGTASTSSGARDPNGASESGA